MKEALQKMGSSRCDSDSDEHCAMSILQERAQQSEKDPSQHEVHDTLASLRSLPGKWWKNTQDKTLVFT